MADGPTTTALGVRLPVLIQLSIGLAVAGTVPGD
jgi:hypothetical protein